MLVRGPHFYVVDALGVVRVGPQSCVGEVAVLPDGQGLNRAEICERIGAGVVVELIATHECSQGKNCIGTDQVRPRRCNVEGLDLGALVRRSQRIPERINGADVKIIERIWRLEPGTSEPEVELHRIRLGELEVHPIKQIFFVASVVHDLELWRIEKSSCIEATYCDVIARLIATIGYVESRVGAAEVAVRGAHTAMRRFVSHPGTRGYFDDHTGFIAEFSRRSS